MELAPGLPALYIFIFHPLRVQCHFEKHLFTFVSIEKTKNGISVALNETIIFLNIFLLFSIFCFTIHMTNLTDRLKYQIEQTK